MSFKGEVYRLLLLCGTTPLCAPTKGVGDRLRARRLGQWLALALCLHGWATVCAQNEFAADESWRSGFHLQLVELQTLLDRHHISGNCIDGVWGRKTEVATVTWQALRGLPITGRPDAATFDSLNGVTNFFLRYTITAADAAGLRNVPDAWEERALLPRLDYETLQEMLAERGHLSQRALERLNPTVAWPNPAVGTEVTLPDCATEKLPKAKSLAISLSRMEVTAYDHEGHLLALFPCSIAAEKKRRPDGLLTVQTIAPNPNYTYDPQLFFPGGAKTSKLIIPPGPNNPVGVAWIGLSRPGYGIHGTPNPERIGRAESKGCFRLANWNAHKLLQMVEIGIPVLIEE